MDSMAMFAAYAGKKSVQWRCHATPGELLSYYQRELAVVDRGREASSLPEPLEYDRYRSESLLDYTTFLQGHLQRLPYPAMEKLTGSQDMWLPRMATLDSDQKRLEAPNLRTILLRRCLAFPRRLSTMLSIRDKWQAVGWELPVWSNTVPPSNEKEELHCFWHSLQSPYPGDRPFDFGILDLRSDASAEFASQAYSLQTALTDMSEKGLQTAVATSGLKVILWCYYYPTNVPTGVEVRNASSLLSAVKAKALLLNREHIAHVADIVRFRAMANSHCKFSWFADVETLWAKHVSFVLSKLPAMAMGHFTGSALSRPSLIGHTSMDFEIAHCTKYLAKPRDGLGVQPPFRLPAGSPVFVALRQCEEKYFPLLGKSDQDVLCYVGCAAFRGPGGRARARWGACPDVPWNIRGPSDSEPHAEPATQACSLPSKVHYQVFMDCLDMAVEEYGLEYAVGDFAMVAPLHSWSKTRPLQEHGGYQPATELLCHSLCITNFWSTSKFLSERGATVAQLGSRTRIENGSVMDEICSILLPARLRAECTGMLKRPIIQVRSRLSEKTEIHARKRPHLVAQSGIAREDVLPDPRRVQVLRDYLDLYTASTEAVREWGCWLAVQDQEIQTDIWQSIHQSMRDVLCRLGGTWSDGRLTFHHASDNE